MGNESGRIPLLFCSRKVPFTPILKSYSKGGRCGLETISKEKTKGKSHFEEKVGSSLTVRVEMGILG